MEISKRLSCIFLFFITNFVFGSTLTRYVDTDVSGGAGDGTSFENAYSCLEDWESSEQCDLTDNGGDVMCVYCKSSSGTDDSNHFTITGWTTGPNCYIEIIGYDFPSDGIWDDSAYVLSSRIAVYEDYVRFRKLQIENNATGTDHLSSLFTTSIGTPNYYLIDSCIFKSTATSTGIVSGIRPSYSSTIMDIVNCVVYGFNVDSSHYGIYCNSCTTVNIYNCTVYDCYHGIYEQNGTVSAYNCAVGNCTDDFYNVDCSYCCSDDGDGGDSQSPSGGSWANEFNNTSGGDFSLKSGGNCVGNGTDDPGSGLYSDDIIDTSRSSTWDIGAFEYEEAEESAGQIIIINMM